MTPALVNTSKQHQVQNSYKKRASMTVDIDILCAITETIIQKQEAEMIKVLFSKLDSLGAGTISAIEAADILAKCEFKMEYKDLKQIVKSEMDKNKWKRINFISMCKLFLASQEHERQDQEQEDMEYIDAFVAMGGNPDKSGAVRKDKLIDVIKNEFQLTIDIEQLIEKSLLNCQELSFFDFCQMFESAGEEIKSKVSLLSEVNEKSSRNIPESSNNFSVRYKDFMIWDQKTEDLF